VTHAALARTERTPVPSRRLRIGGPADRCERDADRAADEAIGAGVAAHHWSLSTMRAAAPPRAASGSGAPEWAPSIVHEVLGTPGHGLDGRSLRFFERTYGSPLGDVRLHTGRKAAESADAVGARAYTVGQHVVFNAGEYAPESNTAPRVLAHELAHVAKDRGAPTLRRQPKPDEAGTGTIRPLVQKFIRGEANEQEKRELQALLTADQLSPAEVDALKQHIGRQIAQQVLKQTPGQININIGGPTRDVHTFFKARLKLKVSGALRAVGKGLEGTLETVVEATGDASRKKVTLRITPPPGETMLAELVRAKVFPKGELTFELGEGFLKALNMISIGGEITIVLTGKKSSSSAGLVISSPEIPSDVELEATLSQSAEKPQLAEATGSPAKPPIRAFVTGGYVADPAQKGAATTAGLDVPLGTDTTNPLAYLAVGARAGADTRGGARVGGAVGVGLNLNPVVLQLAFDAGIARFPASQTAGGTDARTGGYFGAEASVGVRVTKRVEILALASLVGGFDREVKPAASAQVGAGFTF
jgi:hypothetical protein